MAKKFTRKKNLLVAPLASAMTRTNAHAKDFSSDELQRRMLVRRPFEVAIWSMPIASWDSARQAFFGDCRCGPGVTAPSDAQLTQ